MSLRSPLGTVLGFGSARQGVHHWWVQRLSAVALVPLGIWLVVSLLTLPSLDYTTVIAWMSGSWTALALVLFVLTASWHSQLGVRVIVEDYVHGSGPKMVALIVLTFVHVLIAAAGVLAILKVTFGRAS